MEIVKKLINNITNGILLIILGIMHTHLGISSDGFGKQFSDFSKSYFYKISSGVDELPANIHTDFETHAAFWFIYFGILLIPLGLLVHFMEQKKQVLPNSFTISYLVFVLIGSYMIPNSGMTFFMLPHAVYMLSINQFRKREIKKNIDYKLT